MNVKGHCEIWENVVMNINVLVRYDRVWKYRNVFEDGVKP